MELVTTPNHTFTEQIRQHGINRNNWPTITTNDVKTRFDVNGVTYYIYIWIQEQGNVKDNLSEFIRINETLGCIPLQSMDPEDVWANDNVDTEKSFYLYL